MKIFNINQVDNEVTIEVIESLMNDGKPDEIELTPMETLSPWNTLHNEIWDFCNDLQDEFREKWETSRRKSLSKSEFI